jgi:alpha 1,3-glucosidase
MHKSSYEGLKKRLGNKRPFVLTRSYYIGSHKYSAAWTGDNIATFSDLELSLPMMLNHALCGFSFIGADVGGFSKDTDHVLMFRWYQVNKLLISLVRSVLPFFQRPLPQ